MMRYGKEQIGRFASTAGWTLGARPATALYASTPTIALTPEHVEQHLCADKGYDYEDVHQVVAQERYVCHIKHHRRRNEPLVEECPLPGELRYPTRRSVVERTLG